MQRGLSIVEMLVTIAMFSIIMIAIVNSILYFYRANTSSVEQSFQLESARRGIELLIRDLREASYGDNGAFPLAEIASTTVTFYSDTDRDTDTEQITYTLSETNLIRTVVEPSGTPPQYTGTGTFSYVSTYVRNLEEGRAAFRYYNASGNEITDPADIVEIVSVDVVLVVNILPQRAPEEFTLKSSATLRNLRPQ